MSFSPNNTELMEDLRQLAGGQGWLVEQAFRQVSRHPQETVPLRKVVRYILDYRLEHEDLPSGLARLLEQFRRSWKRSADLKA